MMFEVFAAFLIGLTKFQVTRGDEDLRAEGRIKHEIPNAKCLPGWNFELLTLC